MGRGAGRGGRRGRLRWWRRRGQAAWPWVPAAAGQACARGACGRSRRTWATGPDAVRPPTTATPPGTATAASSAGALGQAAGAARVRLARRPERIVAVGCRPAGRRGRTGGCPRRRPRRGRTGPGSRPARTTRPLAGSSRTRCRASGCPPHPRPRRAAACRPAWPRRRSAGRAAASPPGRASRRPCSGRSLRWACSVPTADHVDRAANRDRAVVGERLGQAADAARRARGDAYDRVRAFGLSAAEQHSRAPARRRRPVVDRLREARQRARVPPAAGKALTAADEVPAGVESAGRIDRAAHPGDCRILDRARAAWPAGGRSCERRRRDRAAAHGARLASASAFPVAAVVCPPLPPQPKQPTPRPQSPRAKPTWRPPSAARCPRGHRGRRSPCLT